MAYLRKLSNLLTGNFFLIYLIAQLFVLTRGWDPPLPQVLYMVNALYGVFLLTKIKNFHLIDYIVIFYIIYIVLNGLLSDYPQKGFLLYKAFIIQVSCIFSYFVGRSKDFEIKVLDRNKWIILVTCLCGLYFFFAMPAWYASMKSEMIKGDTDVMSLGETMRLSAFWAHPYYLVYGLMSIVPFLLIEIFENKKKNYLLYIEFTIIVITIILAQLRVVIACFALFSAYLVYSNASNKAGFVLKFAGLAAITGIIVTYIVFNYLDTDAIAYIFEHSSNLQLDDRLSATSGGNQLDTFFGGGFGRYSLKTANTFAIIDNEYQKLLAEIGIFGFSIVIFIFLLSVIHIVKVKGKKVEKMIVVYYMIACIGASCLSNMMQYPFIFWLALGSLWNGRLLNRYNLVSSKNRKI